MPINKPRSITSTITLWYSCAFGIFLTLAAILLYETFRASLNSEIARTLSDRRSALVHLLQTQPETAKFRIEKEWAARPEKIYAQVIDRNGALFSQSPNAPEDFQKPLSNLGHRYRIQTQSLQAPEPYTIRVFYDMEFENTLLTHFQSILFLVLGSIFLTSLLVAPRLARRAFAPIRVINSAMDRISHHDLSQRLDENLPEELKPVATTFNQMIQRLEHPVKRLSQFSADIAHELRTPINNLRGEIEVALTFPRSNDEYQTVLSSGLEECERISKIIENLLFLVRTEDPQFQIQKEWLETRKEIQTILDYFEAEAAEHGLSLVNSVQMNTPLLAERVLLQRAVSNLLSNAIKASKSGTTIQVAASESAAMTTLSVSDQGKGIPSDKLDRVFDRFFQIDPSRSGGIGTGLGLSLAHGIMQLHQGQIQIQSVENQGTTVALQFPRPKHPL